MKSKIWISTFREIKETLGRFLAILAIVALGVGFFAGLKVTGPAMLAAMERYFIDTQFYDYRLISTLGFEDQDVEALAQMEGVKAAEGAVYYDIIAENEEGISSTLRVHSITEEVNKTVLVAGRLPEKEDEIALDSMWFSPERIGEKVILSASNTQDDLEKFKAKELTITGLVQSPLYIQYERGNTTIGNGVIDAFAVMTKDALDCEVYKEVYAKLEEDYPIYADEYKDMLEAREDEDKDFVQAVADARYNRIVDEAQGKIDDAKAELTDGEKELNDAKEKVADGQRQIEDGKKEIADNQKKIDDGRKQIDSAKEELEAAKLMYAGLMDFSAQEAELKKQEKELDKAQKKIDDALIEIAEHEQEIADAQVDIEKADKDIADAKEEIADGQKEIDDLKAPEVYVLGRSSNVGYVCFESDSSIVDGIANVFPVFFFLVAAMVCMTTMTRMVEEQRTQIGVLKALGYSEFSIMGKYTFYSGTAALLGVAVGFTAGTIIFPKAIWFAYNMMYHTNDVTYYFSPVMLTIGIVVALICSVGTTYVSCHMELKEMAASLTRPKAPKAGKRIFLEYITPLWNRLKFLRKVSLRNIFRYKKRFFMMILGISGCTALLVTGFGINDSIANIADIQYEKISLYDVVVSFTDPCDFDSNTVLDEMGYEAKKDYLVFQESAMDFMAGNNTKNIYVDIFEDGADFEGFFDFHTTGDVPLEFPKEGEIIINDRLARTYDVKVNDRVSLFSEETGYIDVTVSGINENFIYNYAYISASTYEKNTGKSLECKTAYLNVKEGEDIHAVTATLMEDEDVASLTAAVDMMSRVSSMMESLNVIIILVIGCAGSLAFIVLYNLTNINITERIREIATIKVLGFYANETAAYVFRENILLTIMGAAVGLLLGKGLHAFVMREVVVDMITFDVRINGISYVIGFVMTLVFTVLVNLFMRGKLNSISMTESLKSVD